MTSRKETTVKEADAKAAKLKLAEECRACILEQSQKLESGEEHSLQPMFAYQRQLNKLAKEKEQEQEQKKK